jgi:GNAT superfamily N-acetyltransferase
MPEIGRAWVAGWVVSHGSPQTVPEPWGLRIEVGAPGHAVRHVLFDADDATIRALAESVTIPTTSMKGFTESANLARLLAPDWTPDPPHFLMTVSLRSASVSIAGDYTLAVEQACGVTCARVLAAGGSVAARGHVAVTGETCVFDTIETEPDHQRRGLGSAVMTALTNAAMDLGATTGILSATVQGRALYEALGWHVAGPVSGFVYKRVIPAGGQG